MKLEKTKEWELVGGLSKPGKMPCFSYSIPATRCKTGSKMRSIHGSVCENCYARKGRYIFSNVKNALEKRFQSIKRPDWVSSMVSLIQQTHQEYFRWHDSGDIQNINHLAQIVEIAEKCPNVKFWLPTKEISIVKQFKENHKIPENLCIRISAPMKGQQIDFHHFGHNSMVIPKNTKTKTKHPYFTCPAPQTNNKCGTCRACWDHNIPCIAYHEH